MRICKVKQVSWKGVEEVDQEVYSLDELEGEEAVQEVIYRGGRIELNECPFCGFTGMLSNDGTFYFGICNVCGSRGPRDDEGYVAGKLWNSRKFSDHNKYRNYTAEYLGQYVDLNNFNEEAKKYLLERA